MKINLKYGNKIRQLGLPDYAKNLKIKPPKVEINKNKFVSDIHSYLKNAINLSKIGIIISDKTRLCGYPQYLPWLTEALVEKGASPDNITFYVAYGTHAKQTEKESLNCYGRIYHEYKFVNHDGDEAGIFKNFGTTKRGTPIRVRRDILDSSLIITFGAISHHYFAGFGGGRKLFFPGLGAKEDIYKNHGLYLDREKKTLAEGCQPGVLAGNPIAEDLHEIDSHLPKRISIHGIIGVDGNVCKLIIGDSYADFLKACQEHDKYYKTDIDDQYDLIIASAGGFPKDINFIQAHKSIHNASKFVKDRGKLILFAECIDGIGSNSFLKFFEMGSFERAFQILETNYEGNGGTALAMIKKSNRINIYMETLIEDTICDLLKVTKLSNKDIQSMIDKEQGSMAVIENADLLIR